MAESADAGDSKSLSLRGVRVQVPPRARKYISQELLGYCQFFNICNSAFAEIEISFRFNDAGQKEMRAAIDEFEKKNPGIKVDLQRIAWGSAR